MCVYNCVCMHCLLPVDRYQCVVWCSLKSSVEFSIQLRISLIPSQLLGEKKFLQRNTCKLTENEDRYCTLCQNAVL